MLSGTMELTVGPMAYLKTRRIQVQRMLSEAMELTIGPIEHMNAGVTDDIKCKMSN